MIEAARKAAAPEFADAVHFWCEAPRANRPDDPPIAPTKILDNVYAIGNSGTTVYVVRTSAGLLMIDALFANQVDTQLLPGFRALGLDPAQVRSSSSRTATPITSAARRTFRRTSDRRCTSRPPTGC